MKTFSQRVLTLAISSVFAVSLSQAATYSYATWDTDTLSSGNTAGTVSGTITLGGSTVNVTYSGDVASQTQVSGSTGINYFGASPSSYIGGPAGNAPGADNTIIALDEQASFTNTITFSSAVVNPIIDVMSLGNYATPVSYTFSGTPVIVASGGGIWGGSAAALSVNGNTVTGTEGYGAIEFVGTFTSLSFTTTGGESWNGITVGAQVPAAVTPEPSSLLLGLGALGIAVPFVRRRKA